MQTRLEFSRGSQESVTVLINDQTFSVHVTAKRAGTASVSDWVLDNAAQLAKMEQEMSTKMLSMNFILLDMEQTQ